VALEKHAERFFVASADAHPELAVGFLHLFS
jgi:hypothetical protein